MYHYDEIITRITLEEALSVIEGGLAHSGFEVAEFRTENDQIYVAYEPLFASSIFVKPEVRLEFGAGPPDPHLALKYSDVRVPLPSEVAPERHSVTGGEVGVPGAVTLEAEVKGVAEPKAPSRPVSPVPRHGEPSVRSDDS